MAEVWEIVHEALDRHGYRDASHIRGVAVEAAEDAARQAQVAILGKLSDLLLEQRDKLTRADLLVAKRRLGLEEAAGIARSLAKTLEAGGGQTGAEVAGDDG